MIERLGARAITMIVGALLLVGLILFAVNSCNSSKSAKKQAEVSEGQAGASIGAGAEAGNTAGNVAASDDATDAAVAAGQDAIRSTPEGLKGAAARREACRLKTYRDTPQCKGATP